MDPVLAANAADAETQKLRLQALNGKRCLWITAPVIPMMSQGMIDRTQWVLDQGVELCAVFCGEEDRLYSIMKEKNLFSNAIFADLNSDDCGSQIIAAVEESGLQIDSVFSPYEQAQTIVGEVATGLGVQANDGKAYSIARSKNWTRDVCKEHNLAAPKTGICHTVEELIATVEHVGFPLILKPSSGAGSAGVFKATTIEQAEKAFHIIVADLTKNDNLNWNPGCNENSCLVEQLLVGDEFDVDILMWDSKPVYVRSVDNWPCMEPFFLETGSNLPSVYPREKLDILEKYALDCVLACGFTFGCFHVECMYTEEGPVLIEVNARQGGGCMQEFNAGIYGVDIFANFFISTFGIPINPPRTEKQCAMADYSFTCETTGTLENIDWVKQVEQNPHVVRCTPFAKPGSKVVGFDTGFPVWLGEVIVQGETPEQCKEIIASIVETTTFAITPASEKQEKSEEPHEVEPAQEVTMTN